MTKPDAPDRLALVLAGIGLLFVVIIIVFALVPGWRSSPQPSTTSIASVQDIERALAAAKKACVEGLPQGPSCVEAARLTTELAKTKGTQ
jgi:hypothetical protein